MSGITKQSSAIQLLILDRHSGYQGLLRILAHVSVYKDCSWPKTSAHNLQIGSSKMCMYCVGHNKQCHIYGV